MTLEILQAEMISAMKAKQKNRKEAISNIIQAIKKTAIDKGCKDNITEELISEVLLKEQKTAQEMIDTCPPSRADLLAEYTEKKATIDEFAPKILSNPIEVEKFITSLGIEITKKNRGLIMKELKGKVDMKIANQIISKKLNP